MAHYPSWTTIQSQAKALTVGDTVDHKFTTYTVDTAHVAASDKEPATAGGNAYWSPDTTASTYNAMYGERAKQPTVADPTGGVVVDIEARTAINTIIDRLQALELIN